MLASLLQRSVLPASGLLLVRGVRGAVQPADRPAPRVGLGEPPDGRPALRGVAPRR